MRKEYFYRFRNLHLRMMRAREQAFAHLFEPMPIGTSQAATIHALWHNPNISQGQLAEILGIQPGSLSEMLKKLEKNGYVERRRDPEDQRILLVSLSPQGLDFFNKYQGHHEEEVASMFDEISDDELAEFCRLYEKVVHSWEEGVKKI